MLSPKTASCRPASRVNFCGSLSLSTENRKRWRSRESGPPLTTTELLIAKVLGSLLPAIVVAVPGLLLYLGAIALFADSGVLSTMITWRSAAAIGLLAPGLSLIALQLTVLFATRVQDEDTARQLAIVGVLPFGGLIVAQFTGRLWLSAGALAACGVGLIGAWFLLLALSVAVFDRDAVLTRWR